MLCKVCHGVNLMADVAPSFFINKVFGGCGLSKQKLY